MLSPETPLTLTLPAGVWDFFMQAARQVPAPRNLTDQIFAEVEPKLQAAIAEAAPQEPPATAEPDQPNRAARRAAPRRGA